MKQSNAVQTEQNQTETTETVVNPTAADILAIPPKSEAVATPAELIAKYGTKSAAIRALHASGMDRGAVAKALKIRYQHVRNVLITPVKKVAAPVQA
jgi:hypothetical protein